MRSSRGITMLILSFLWLIVLGILPISGFWKFILILLTWPLLIPAVLTLAGIGAALLPIILTVVVGAVVIGILFLIAAPLALIIVVGIIPLLIIGWMMGEMPGRYY